jgi:hypothetical protein
MPLREINTHDEDRMLHCHKALDFLHKSEPDAIRAIIETIKFELDEIEASEIRHFYDLPIHMLHDDIYNAVIKIASQVVLNSSVLSEFLRLIADAKGGRK